jgi:hypothetical protein
MTDFGTVVEIIGMVVVAAALLALLSAIVVGTFLGIRGALRR